MKDIVHKLEFGCPFKPGTIGEKDAERAEQWMEEGAKEITRLRAENKELVDALTDIIEACSPPGVPNIHYILKRAQEAVKAKGQGGE